mgnify:CR=1 FL=1
MGIDPCENEDVVEKTRNGHLRDEVDIVSGRLDNYEPIPVSDVVNQPILEKTEKTVKYSINGEHLRRTPNIEINFDSDKGIEFGVDCIANRWHGNVINLDINEADLDIREVDDE